MASRAPQLSPLLAAADQLSDWLQGSASAKLSGTDRDSLLGLAPISGLVRRQSRKSLTGNLNLSLDADFGNWLVSFIGTHDYQRARTQTDRLDPGDPLVIAPARTVPTTRSTNADLVATGPLLDLPAGPLRGTLGFGLGWDSIKSSQRFLGIEIGDHFDQSSRNARVAIEVPLASRAKGFLKGLGELVANAEFTRTQVSDFGSFTNQTFSLQWQPDDWIRLFGSITTGKSPPAVSFISDPIIETPGVRYYDPLVGETVDVTEISGGNPELGLQRAESRRLSLNMRPTRGYSIANSSFVRAWNQSTYCRRMPSGSVAPAGRDIASILPWATLTESWGCG